MNKLLEFIQTKEFNSILKILEVLFIAFFIVFAFRYIQNLNILSHVGASSFCDACNKTCFAPKVKTIVKHSYDVSINISNFSGLSP